MLQFLRESVYDGSIPKPKPKPDLPLVSPTMPAALRKPRSTLYSVLHPSPGNFEDPELENMRDLTRDVCPRATKIEALHILWPTPFASYAHAKDCIHSPSVRFSTRPHIQQRIVHPNGNPNAAQPTIKLLVSLTSFLRMEAKHTAKMAQLREQSWKQWDVGDFDDRIEERICEMREELTASRLAKGVFFRRCNGSYINCLGWVWEDEEETNEERSADDRDGCQGKEIDTTANTTEANSHVPQREASLDTGDIHTQLVQNLSKAHSSKPNNSNPDSNTMACPSVAQTKEQVPRISTNRLKPREDLRHHQSTAHSNLSTSQDADEDLIITCWAWHSQTHRHARPETENQKHTGHAEEDDSKPRAETPAVAFGSRG